MLVGRARWGRRALVAGLAATLGAAGMAAPASAAPATTRVSSTSGGAPANNTSGVPGVSDDGRYVTFRSSATNLVRQSEHNFWDDVFIKDRQTGAVEQISLTHTGEEGEFFSGGFGPSPVSPDGRYVAFDAYAANLVPGDTNQLIDVFVRDRRARTTTRVSVSSYGGQADSASAVRGISADGRYVLFVSRATNLVPGDTNGSVLDAFVHDRATGRTTLVSRTRSGSQVAEDTHATDLSADGRFVTLESRGRLTGGDNNDAIDGFVKDLRTGSVERVTISNSEREFANGGSGLTMSADGRLVAFSGGPPDVLPQIYVRDRERRTTTLVSVNLQGRPANRSSFGGSISADGRYVAFGTGADDMVRPAPTPYFHTYVRDLANRRTVLASVTSAGAPIPQSTNWAFMSATGVAFTSFYADVVPDGNAGKEQVYFRSL